MILGVDGCRGGWCVWDGSSVSVVGPLSLGGAERAVAVDMPMGLPAAGRRACDVEARRRLGVRRSSVFPAPSRAALAAASFADVSGLSLQAWHLVPKVRELDSLLTPALQSVVVEAHPELSFATLAGAPMASPKRTAAGRAERLAALGRLAPDPFVVPRGAAADDVLDAVVLRWTAARWASGTALVLGDGARDERGLAMRIVA